MSRGCGRRLRFFFPPLCDKVTYTLSSRAMCMWVRTMKFIKPGGKVTHGVQSVFKSIPVYLGRLALFKIRGCCTALESYVP